MIVFNNRLGVLQPINLCASIKVRKPKNGENN